MKEEIVNGLSTTFCNLALSERGDFQMQICGNIQREDVKTVQCQGHTRPTEQLVCSGLLVAFCEVLTYTATHFCTRGKIIPVQIFAFHDCTSPLAII